MHEQCASYILLHLGSAPLILSCAENHLSQGTEVIGIGRKTCSKITNEERISSLSPGFATISQNSVRVFSLLLFRKYLN